MSPQDLGGYISGFGTPLLSMGLTAYLGHKIQQELKNTPVIPKEKIPEVYKQVGIDPNLPTVPYGNLQNAFYSPPGFATTEIAQRFKGINPKLKFDKKKLKELGLIAYDPKWLRAGILAHEAGHAKIRTKNKWYSPSRLNQSVGRYISGAALPFSPMISYFAAMDALKGGDKPWLNALIGGGLGLGIGALTAAPIGINEYQASSHAKNYLDESSLRDKTKAKNKSILNKALMTYMAGPILASTISGALGGAIGNER